MTNKNKINKLFELLNQIPQNQRPNLLIYLDNEFIISYKGILKSAYSRYKNEDVRNYDFNERGDVLEFFTNIEYLINKIIIAYLKIDYTNNEKADALLNTSDLFYKVKLLNEWGLFSSKDTELFFCLKSIRNGFAHTWVIESIKYKGKSYKQNISKFNEDAAIIWKLLLNIYKKYQIDIDEIIEKLELRNK